MWMVVAFQVIIFRVFWLKLEGSIRYYVWAIIWICFEVLRKDVSVRSLLHLRELRRNWSLVYSNCATCPVPDDHTWSNIENFSFTNDFNNEVDRPSLFLLYIYERSAARREKGNYNATELLAWLFLSQSLLCPCNVQSMGHPWVMAWRGGWV